ncbi:bacterial regulatory proteins, tetR family [Variibacter gotjawalensis]|uniref:Bacterial regulatory proteins, tetR family n=1 Tax=Variibacter gotjawalensis TaxID=1333996 RepID=A0A0S3PVC4_9BRAD|nr:TetR/AcrR family transcriptional regulator [Variibacter gotjawalensis]NIK45733.1 AcrR family transcriptional regulator [Variibacter gotjawalensis]RZS47657.1 TetR family transcriptional regulator [Variibacter gotjawalensis]BAT59910.1 bacterial regulatory proteins, tetR family [Variibacter gotjawalensis]
MTKKDPLARQGYHHGNLKEALVIAARKLIAERGPAGFTLVEAARLAGVSPAAPYRHFKDRAALVAEVAQQGFQEFGKRMGAAAKAAATDKEGFMRMGDTYLAFAREEPGYYAAMFSGGYPLDTAEKVGQATFDGLANAIRGVAHHMRAEGKGEIVNIDGLAYYVWAMSHGIATLSAAGFLPDREPRPSPDVLLQDGVEALVRGSLAPPK